MPSYYNWGIHVNQTGPLVFSSLLEHVLVTIDNLMVLRFTLLEIKNNESHVNILTVNLKITQSEIVNIFTHNIDLYIGTLSFIDLFINSAKLMVFKFYTLVTQKHIIIFNLSESEKINVDVKVVPYTSPNLRHLFIAKDF